MPTNYTDQFFTLDPANPPPVGTLLTVSTGTLTDQNDDNDIDNADGDAVNGSDVTASWPGDTVTVFVAGVGNITYTGITFYLADGSRVFTPTDGQVLQQGTLVSTTFVNTEGPLDVGDLGPPCFVAGTLIETDRGLIPVEGLAIGSLVRTADNGLQPVRWIGQRRLSGAALARASNLHPIRIAEGSLSPGVPTSALLVSPQHRILVRSRIAERMFGAREILVAACQLVGVPGISVAEDVDDVTYVHILFDRHEIVISNGAQTESLYPGPMVLRSLDRKGLIELLTLFPGLSDFRAKAVPSRQLVPGRRGRKLAERHHANNKPLVARASV